MAWYRRRRVLTPVLFGSGVYPAGTFIWDDYSDTTNPLVTGSRAIAKGQATVINGALMNTDGSNLNSTGNSADLAGIVYTADGSAITIANGLLFVFTRNTTPNGEVASGCLRTTATIPNQYDSSGVIMGNNYGVTMRYNGGYYNNNAAIFGAGVDMAYWFSNDNAYVFSRAGGGGGDWVMRHVFAAIAGDYYAVVQATFAANSNSGTFEQIAARQSVNISALTLGTTAGSTQTAPDSDVFISGTLTTLPSSGSIELRFRIQDADNYWRFTLDSSGDMALDEVASGSPTTRASQAAGASNGDILNINCNGVIIDCWSGTTKITYGSATAYQTETNIELESLGTDGVLADLLVHRAIQAGSELTILDGLAKA